MKLFDAEFRFMGLLWREEPLTSTELSKLCEKEFGWKKATTYSMIKKLQERNIIKNEKAVVSSIAKREEVQQYESDALLKRAFDDSVPAFLNSFLKGRTITQEEAESLKMMIEEAIES